MSDMKNLDGHGFVDVVAREEIGKLKENGVGGSGGQPIVVKTASYMTDSTAIYLYMGDGETVSGVVYEKGYIYIYDTDTAKWVNSGLYGKGQDGADGKDGADGTATDEQVKSFVDDWLDEHPEATTTVGDKTVTPEKTTFIKSDAVQPEDIVGDLVVTQTWGAYPSEPMYVENVNFLYIEADSESLTNIPGVTCYFVDVAEDGTVTENGSATKIVLQSNIYITPYAYKSVHILNGYTGYIIINYAGGITHIYKNGLPQDSVQMLDDSLYKQGFNASYIQKALFYVDSNSKGAVYYPRLLYKAENTAERVKCYHERVADNANAFVSVYDENWNLIETIKGTQVYDLTVSDGIYYLYEPRDNGEATAEELTFLGKEEYFEYWLLNNRQYGWYYTLTDDQVSQVINSQEMEDYTVLHRNALTPRFTYAGELWDVENTTNKYHAWSFNGMKYDASLKKLVFLSKEASAHSSSNTIYSLRFINPCTFESERKQIQTADGQTFNNSLYAFEMLADGSYICLVSYDGGMRLITSTDKGDTWTVGEIIQDLTDNEMYLGTRHPFAMQRLSNDRLFISMDSAQNELLYSDDNGATWLTAIIPMGDITYTMTEPDLTELDDTGTVMMLARSSRSIDYAGTELAETIFSISYDYGATWETAQLSEVRCNRSDATALVHDGIVEVFSCNKYCDGSSRIMTNLVDATGFYGDIRRYYATIEEAKQNIWHYAGIMGFAQTTNPSYDLGSPCCLMTPSGDIWAGFYDKAEDGTSGKVLYRWFVAHKDGRYNFARGLKELAGKITELSAM